MPKLNQIIALVNGKKKIATDTITAAYHSIQKPELLNGVARNYRPKDDDGEQLPPEQKLVQVRVKSLLESVMPVLADTWDMVATQDVANTETGVEILPGYPKVPVTYLLYLEKQLTDMMTFISKLPTLDPAEEWEFDVDRGVYTSSSETTRTKKVPKVVVLYEATKEHPAQVQVVNEDVTAGYWKTTKLSGAIPAAKRNLLLANCQTLKDAVIVAREKANNYDVENVSIGKLLIGSIFQGL